MEKVWLWWSTGKDSAWALHVLRGEPRYTVERLVTTVTPAFGRVAIHGTRLDVLHAQATAVGLPLTCAELPYPCTNADYEAAVQPVIQAAAASGVRYMAFGDLCLADIRAYRERLLAGTSIQSLFPLWHRDTPTLAQEMLTEGLSARIVSLDPARVDPQHLGAPFDAAFLAALGSEVDPCGENGEFHTCVVGGPMFAHAIDVVSGASVEREGFGYHDLLLADSA